MHLMIRPKKDMELWFKENGWEQKKTTMGMGWRKEGYRPFLDSFYFYDGRIFDDEDTENYEERQDEEGRKLLYFSSVNKHFYQEWLQPALQRKLDALFEE